jgi:hypothetical protein
MNFYIQDPYTQQLNIKLASRSEQVGEGPSVENEVFEESTERGESAQEAQDE